LEKRIFEGISDRRGDFTLAGKKISNPHDEVNILHSCWAPERAGAAGGACPQFRPFEKQGRIVCISCLSNKPPHVQGRPELDRTPTRTGAALDAEVQMVILNEGLRINFHLVWF
jgi:hypothetical protein